MTVLFAPLDAALRSLGGRRFRLGTILPVVILAAGMIAASVVVANPPVFAVDSDGDFSIAHEEKLDLGMGTQILDRDGRLLGRLDPGYRRRPVKLEKIPEALQNAVLAIEDDQFYEHDGIRPVAIVRAFLANLGENRVEQGGSTITQQLVRNVYPSIGRERTLERKIREATAARELERMMTKDQILQDYLNTIYLGRSAFGVDAAARAYFGVPVKELGLARAAFIAGLIHRPEYYRDKPKEARARRNVVLGRMAELGMITERRAERIGELPITLRAVRRPKVRAPYFVEYVRRQLKAPEADGGFGMTDTQILRGGYTIHTTLDLQMQRAAERAVRAIANRKGDPEVGLVSLATGGQIRAMIGGRGQGQKRGRGFNYATQMAGGGRSPGSTFKTFTLATYIEQDRDLTDTYPAPAEVEIEDCGGGDTWTAANYDERSHGYLDPIRATEGSVNTVFAQMIDDVGPSDVASMAYRLGVESELDDVCPLTLGTSGVTPLEMARAYATFATRGVRSEIVAVKKIVAPGGKVVARAQQNRVRVIDREVADTVTAVLERVMERGTGTPARIARPTAGKTGTSESKRDLWFAGYTPHPGLATVVWVGHRPGRSGWIEPVADAWGRPATGGSFAGGIWREFMQDALRGMTVRSFNEVELFPAPAPRPQPTATTTITVDEDDAGDDGDDRDGQKHPPGREKKKD